MMHAFLLGLLLVSTVQGEHGGTEDTPRLMLDVDFIQFDSDFLKKIGFARSRPDGFLILDEVEAFFLVECIDGNNKDKNVYARSKDWRPDGKPIKISNRVFDDATKRMIVRNGAWLHDQRFALELTPMLLALTSAFFRTESLRPKPQTTCANLRGFEKQKPTGSQENPRRSWSDLRSNYVMQN